MLEALSAPENVSRIIAGAVTLLVAILSPRIQPAARICYGVAHGFTFLIPPKEQNDKVGLIHTGSVFVQNLGRAAAENVEIHFNLKPEQFEIWPSFDFSTSLNPEGRFIITIKNLGPQEHLTVEMIAPRDLPGLLRVRSKLGEGRKITMRTVEQLPRWKVVVIQGLILLGVFAIAQNVASLVF